MRLVLFLLILVTSCTYRDIEYPLDIDCWIVNGKGIYESSTRFCYYLDVENEATGKIIPALCVSELTYNTHDAGSRYCKK